MSDRKQVMTIPTGMTSCVQVTREKVISYFGLSELPTGLCYEILIKQRDEAVAELAAIKNSEGRE